MLRASGIKHAQHALTAIKNRPAGRVRIIVGVDSGGTSRQGLEAVLDLGIDTWVFHHEPETGERGPTFHPKVYLASSPTHALLLVGSHNLTPGGAYYNYEAGLRATLGRTNEDNEQTVRDVTGYMDLLRSEPDACRPLTPDLLRDLGRER